MDDEQIEKMLRESWQPQPPDGMRERVLGKARERAHVRREWFLSRWQTAFTLAGLLIVLVSFASDSARQSRLAALGGNARSSKSSLVASRPVTMADWQIELDHLMNGTPDKPH